MEIFCRDRNFQAIKCDFEVLFPQLTNLLLHSTETSEEKLHVNDELINFLSVLGINTEINLKRKRKHANACSLTLEEKRRMYKGDNEKKTVF